jgi:hypothetical protein
MNFIRASLINCRAQLFLIAPILVVICASYAFADERFFIERPKLGLGTSYEFEEEKRENPGSDTKTNTHDWIESATIASKGWMYHPNLMEYRFAFQPEWEQEDFKEWTSTPDSTQTSSRDSSVLVYDTGVTFFKQKPCSLDVFANRNNRKIDLSYTQDTDIDYETWGTRLSFTNRTLPGSIGYVNTQTDQTGFYRSHEDRHQLQSTIRHNLKNSITELEILQDVTDLTTYTSSGAIDTDSNTTNSELTNTYFFRGDESLRLDSQFYLNQGDYDDVQIDNWLGSENFFWTHSKALLSQYSLNFNRQEVDDAYSEEKALKALLTNRQDNGLTTNAGARIVYEDFTGGDEDSFGPNLSVLYRKPIPLGNIQLGAAYDYAVTNRNGTGSIIPTEERLVLTTGEEPFLEKENIVIESILVTDVTSTIVYTNNIDYRVQEVGPEVRISRVILGSIKDGQQVIVRYNYRVDAGYDDALLGQEYRFDLDLWSMTYFTYTHRRLDQSILSGYPPVNQVDDTFNNFLLRFVIGWTETRFSYEIQDRENGNSNETRSVSEQVNFRPFRYVSLNFSGRYGNREFTDTNEDETFYTLGTDMSWAPTWWCTFSLVCIRNKIFGDLEDMLDKEINPTVQFTYGVWTASIVYKLMDQEDRDYGDSLWQQRIYFSVNRALW